MFKSNKNFLFIGIDTNDVGIRLSTTYSELFLKKKL